MQIDEYKTIETKSEGFFKDKGSKFFAFAFPVTSDQEIAEKRNLLKKKFHDARHHVYAFVLGTNGNNTRSSDDGEPSNSSGPPILGQINSAELCDVLVVVIRYFGGTKLGIPGLINAYKTAAANAIANANIITKTIERKIIVQFDYPLMNAVMRCAKQLNLKFVSQDFKESCEITYTTKLSQLNEHTQKLSEIYGTKVIS